MGEPEGLVVRADAQIRGRGRHGRGWASPRGNLYASVLLRPSVPAAEIATLSLVAGLALAEALARLGIEPALKWPNDVLVGGAKLAGLLAEALTSKGHIEAVVLGLGVNVGVHPDLPDRPTACLKSLGLSVEPEALLGHFLASLDPAYARWQAGGGFAPLRGAWLARAANLGEAIVLREGDATFAGRFVDVDAAGRLCLASEDGLRRFGAGELLTTVRGWPDGGGEARE